MGFQQFNTGNLDDDTFKRIDRLVKQSRSTKAAIMKKIIMAGLSTVEEEEHKEVHQTYLHGGFDFCPRCGKALSK